MDVVGRSKARALLANVYVTEIPPDQHVVLLKHCLRPTRGEEEEELRL
jgi:hypothetical protein